MQVFHHSTLSMGTRLNMVLPEISDARGMELSGIADRILGQQEAILSCHAKDSELTRVNQSAYYRWVVISDGLAHALDACHALWEQTGGAFDPGLYTITQGGRNTHIPTEKQIDNTDCHIGWTSVHWDSPSRRIRFREKTSGIDLGGFGKGWALEMIIKRLKNEGITSGFISFGESSMATIGTHPHADRWEVTIIHPTTGAKVNISLKDSSISVSGLKKGANKGGLMHQPHIISPHNLTMVSDNRMIVVQSPSPLRAEVLSTALIAANGEQRQQLIQNFPDERFLVCEPDSPLFIEIS